MSAMTSGAAGALIRDGDGRVLIVEPTYKDAWEIPGGMLEVGETPTRACARELVEELGQDVPVGRLLVVDWAPHPVFGDRVFVFDGGTLDPARIAAIRLPADELASYAFAPPAELPARLVPRLSRRVTEALAALADGTTRYLEHGLPVPAAPGRLG